MVNIDRQSKLQQQEDTVYALDSLVFSSLRVIPANFYLNLLPKVYYQLIFTGTYSQKFTKASGCISHILQAEELKFV